MRVLACWFALVIGCAAPVPVPRAPKADPTEAWVRLATSVGSDGGVDFERLAAERATVDAMVGWTARHGVEKDLLKESQENDRLAGLLNAWNVNVAYSLLRQGPPPDLDHAEAGGPRWAVRLLTGPPLHPFFAGTRTLVDDEPITLWRLSAERILARFQEPTVHAALWWGVRGGPTLRGWRPKRLQLQLDDAMRRFLASDRGLRAQGDGYAAHAIFHDYADHFTIWGGEPTVCAWMAAYAQGERARWLGDHRLDCPLGVIPPDWRVDTRDSLAFPEPADEAPDDEDDDAEPQDSR